MEYVTITGQENNIDRDIIVAKNTKIKILGLLGINITHFILTIFIAVFFWYCYL